MGKSVVLDKSLAETVSEILGLPASLGKNRGAVVLVDENKHMVRAFNNGAIFNFVVLDGGMTCLDQFFFKSGLRTVVYHLPNGHIYKHSGKPCSGGPFDKLDDVPLTKLDAEGARMRIRKIAHNILPRLRPYMAI